ncbi:MAG: hypothetical protein ACFE8U_16315 [Candidatus Hermodarchaeota archaeon]
MCPIQASEKTVSTIFTKIHLGTLGCVPSLKYTMQHLPLFLLVLIVFKFVFPVNGCSLVYGTRAQITIFDFEGNKVGNKNLKYLGVDMDCTLKNLVLPAQKNKIYVEDNQGILSLIDLTEEKWKILKNFELNGFPVTYWCSKTIYQNKCLAVRSLVNETVKIHVFDLEKQDSKYLTFDPSWELMNQGKINYSVIDIFQVALNQNWGACLSLINQSSQTTPNSSLQELWVYKFNFNTGEGQSIFQTDFSGEFTYHCQFKISDNGNFAFFDQVIESNQSYSSPHYALKDAYLIDFQNQSISRGYFVIIVGQ